MKKKKSKIELAREIIANLRSGMGKPPLTAAERVHQMDVTPRTGASTPGANQLQTSHS